MRENLHCRPLREEDLHLLDSFAEDPTVLGPYAWTGFSSGLRRRWAETGLLTDDGGVLAVVDQGKPVGVVSWRKAAYNAASHVWSIGLCVLPEARRKGSGEQAARWLIHYLFAHTQTNRLEAHIDAENIASRTGIEKVGFVYEGMARGAAFRNGVWRDMCLYGLLREDLRPAQPTSVQG
ncbi:GNAT family N-acetyltransferase (plasmid) [Streptomyces sp. BHT-5-2]|uniref:GNAT family N-acetyltransferase n=1 Tax=unclassified Streptomyces TaxID=2593676 RepID=UPI001C8D2D23|nr:GNAT family protein [Streptomyces sp. BHT-5-2]QZL08853.1 GNAT family N-acetyltransferase [Streptomyces sp. BHT-5-2]